MPLGRHELYYIFFQEWLTPQGNEFVRDNGQTNFQGGTLDLAIMMLGLWFLLKVAIRITVLPRFTVPHSFTPNASCMCK